MWLHTFWTDLTYFSLKNLYWLPQSLQCMFLIYCNPPLRNIIPLHKWCRALHQCTSDSFLWSLRCFCLTFHSYTFYKPHSTEVSELQPPGQPHISVNNVLLGRSHACLLTCAPGCFHAAMAELSGRVEQLRQRPGSLQTQDIHHVAL